MAPTALSPSPTATASPGGAPPSVIDGVRAVPMEVGDEMEMPDDLALIVETGCWGCDGPASGFVRVYLDAAGDVRGEVLLTIEALDLPPRRVTDGDKVHEESPVFTGFAFAEDGSEMVVGVCTQGWCGGMGYATADAETALFRSTDGGVTWRDWERLEGGYSVVALVSGEVILGSLADPQTSSGARLRLFPSGHAVKPPPAAGNYSWPHSLSGGGLIWPTNDGRVLDADGNELLALSAEGWEVDVGWNVIRDAQRYLAPVIAQRPPAQGIGYYLGVFDEGGVLTDAYSVVGSPFVGAWLGADQVIGNIEVYPGLLSAAPVGYGLVPVLFDLKAGRASPIPHPFVDKSFVLPNIRNRVVAAQHGPFARVVAPGSCLNVRAKPDPDSRPLACAADGVLLRDTGELVEGYGGESWLRVVTPAGVEGWAAVRFLER